MATTQWTWANLTAVQRQQVTDAEDTLGADYLLVYQPSQQRSPQSAGTLAGELHIATLTPSQLECLKGLEDQLQAVVVAYRRA